ncbi:peptidase M16 family protein [Frondihabitans cladoniiphilus]|uniref:Zn-dependent peptidase n=1 Tax=Frondihabitans cladoniiphilus TaxID=715785 RepID=A0ABP8W305_9MICO
MQIVTSTTPNGILVRSASVPGRCFGALTFGVGTRDEPVALAGITHLVLHLIEAEMGSDAAFRAQIDENTLDFTTSGTAAQVTAALRRVAAIIGGLGGVGKSEIARQKHLMHVEEPGSYSSPGFDSATYRFGLDDLGVPAFGFPTLESLTKKDVLAWAGSWLTAENAAVAITKPVGATFDLDLPSGPVPIRRAPISTGETPALVPCNLAGARLSLVVDAASAEQLGEAIRAALKRRLSDEAGLVYSVDLATIPMDVSSTEIVFAIAPLEVDLPEAVRAAVLGLRDFAQDGVSDEALATAADVVRLGLGSDPASIRDWLIEANEASLRGFVSPTRDEAVAAAAAFTPAFVAAALTAALPSLVVEFDDRADLGKVAKKLEIQVVALEALESFTPKAWKKATKDARIWEARKKTFPEGLTAVITAGGLFYDPAGQGDPQRLLFGDLVLVGERPTGQLRLVTVNGGELIVDPADWKQGKQFVKALRKAVPAELVREFPAV